MKVSEAITEIEAMAKKTMELIAVLHDTTQVLIKIKEQNGDADLDIDLDEIQSQISELMGIMK